MLANLGEGFEDYVVAVDDEGDLVVEGAEVLNG